MIWRPTPGQRVELHYKKSMRDWVGLHLACGTVEHVNNGPGPINAVVRLDDGRRVAVPRGNLFNKEFQEVEE
jgi:hypothetical protein